MFKDHPGYLWRPSASVEEEESMPGHRRLGMTQPWSLLSTCETFHGSSGSKKEGVRVPEIIKEAESTLPTAKEATACKVYSSVIGKVIEPQNISPIILPELLNSTLRDAFLLIKTLWMFHCKLLFPASFQSRRHGLENKYT